MGKENIEFSILLNAQLLIVKYFKNNYSFYTIDVIWYKMK